MLNQNNKRVFVRYLVEGTYAPLGVVLLLPLPNEDVCVRVVNISNSRPVWLTLEEVTKSEWLPLM